MRSRQSTEERRFVDDGEVDQCASSLSPATGNGFEDLGLLFAESALLLGCQHQHTAALRLPGKRCEDAWSVPASRGAEVRVSHVGALGTAGETQSKLTKHGCSRRHDYFFAVCAETGGEAMVPVERR